MLYFQFTLLDTKLFQHLTYNCVLRKGLDPNFSVNIPDAIPKPEVVGDKDRGLGSASI